MDFMGAIQAGFKNYANFRGVAKRSEYWYFVLFLILSSLVLSVVDTFIGFGVIGLAFSLVTLIPSLSVLVRRLRDAGYSWTWLLAPITSLASFIAGLVGIVSLGIQAGLFDWAALMQPDAEINMAAIEQIANDPNFYAFGIMTLMGLVFSGISSLLVNIIFPALPSKSAAEGNKRVQPETL